MMRQRWTAALAAACSWAALVPGAAARADVVTATLSQDQANRLSIFHDYGLDVVGNATGDGTGQAGHAAGGYLGQTPLVGTPGQGAAAAIVTRLQDRFTFLQGIQSTSPTGTGRSYDLSLGYVSGYDSNPRAKAAARDGNFFGGTFTAGYHVVAGPDDPVIGSPFRADVAYNALGVLYSGPRAAADAVQQGLGGSVRQSLLADRLVATAAVNDAFTIEHGAAFLNTTDAAAAAEAFATDHLSVEGGYDYARLQYFFRPVVDAQRPTSDRHTLDARVHLYPLSQARGVGIGPHDSGLTLFLEHALRRVTGGYAHVWNFPSGNGSDYRYQADRLYIGLEGMTLPPSVQLFGQPLAQGTTASLFYAHEWQDYGAVNSLGDQALLGAGPGKRSDDLDVFTGRVNTRILDLAGNGGTLASYLQVDVVHDGANVGARHFNEVVVSSGLTYVY